MGNEYVFQAFAEQNVQTLNEAGVTKIITSCPHCFNTLANEYPDFGGSYEVIHHSELLAELVRDGRVPPTAASCRDHLPRLLLPGPPQRRARGPRELVAAVGEPVEMERSGKQTFCCGAGGAHMWMEERAKPINEARVREAAETGAGTLAVACPFCTVMLDDGVQSAGEQLRVVDVATLLAEAIVWRLIAPYGRCMPALTRDRDPRRPRRRRGVGALDAVLLALEPPDRPALGRGLDDAGRPADLGCRSRRSAGSRPAGAGLGRLAGRSGVGNVAGLVLTYRALRIGQVCAGRTARLDRGAVAAVIALIAGEPLAPGVGLTLAAIVAGVWMASRPGSLAHGRRAPPPPTRSRSRCRRARLGQ